MFVLLPRELAISILTVLFGIRLTMATAATTRMISAEFSARHPAAWRWILYLAVGCLVTIYFWTPAALRASVGDLDWWEREMKCTAQPLSYLACMLVGLHAMWASDAFSRGAAAVCAGDRRDMKAVRT